MRKIVLTGLLAVTCALTQQPKFAIADVHLTGHVTAQSGGGVISSGRYTYRDATMLHLIAVAYGVAEDDIVGGPGWVSSELYDVIAKVPDDTTQASAKLMLRALLADRFGLVIENGTRLAPRYLLTVGKESKLKPAANPSGVPGCKSQQNAPPSNVAADPASMPNIRITCSNLTTAALAQTLHLRAGGYLANDVIDETKLEGAFDFELEWTSRGAQAAKGADGISIFDAVEKQLGLKLQAKDVAVPSLEIKSVKRKPTPNPGGTEATLAVSAARFETAAIKIPNPTERLVEGINYSGGSTVKAGGSLRFLIALSLQIPRNIADDMIVGIPKSADSQKWDITAKVPSTGEGAPNMVNGRLQPPARSVTLEMLRGLLVERFGLKTHSENREVTVYALTAPNGRPKMTRAEETERSGCRPDPNAPKLLPNVQMIGCRNTSMTELAQNLQRYAGDYIDHPLVDATGLEGGWDFAIGWTMDNLTRAAQTPSAGTADSASDPSGITIFEAVEKLLGLKLVKQKRSIPVIVVDHVDEKPIE